MRPFVTSSLLACSLLLLTACATKQQVTQVSGPRPKHVCIVQHDAVQSGILEAINDGLKKHNVPTKVVAGTYEQKHSMWQPRWRVEQVEGCDALLFYVANWSWDLALYMRFANIWMTSPDGSRRLGQATYDSSGNIGVGKFIVARDKILELVDQMFSGVSPVAAISTGPGAETSAR